MLPKFGKPRLKFPKRGQKKIVEDIFEKSNLDACGLGDIVGVSPRTIRDWKREKYCISKRALTKLCYLYSIPLPKSTTKLIRNWQQYRFNISQRGGLAFYKKYGLPGTKESRIRGGLAGLAKIRALELAPPIKIFRSPRKSVNLAEFVGIMLGDGSVGKQQMSITLNSIADAKYIKYVSHLCEELFGVTPKLKKKKNCNAVDIYYSGVNLIAFLQKIGLKKGNKVKQQVDVPNWIKCQQKFKIMCLRGLMDTDGGVFLHKYKVNSKQYMYQKICFSNHSIPLLLFVFKVLQELGFNPKIINQKNVVNKKVWLYNSLEVEKYLNIVGSSNLRLNRFKFGGVG